MGGETNSSSGRRGRWRRRLGATTGLAALFVVLLADADALRVSDRVAATLHPPRERVAIPDSLGPLSSVVLRTADGLMLRGWYIPSRNGAAVVLGHGHGAQRAQLAFEARALARRGYGVLLFDWRGHGESDGDGTTWGVAEQMDLEAAIDYLSQRPDVDPHRIGGLGFSMGAMTLAEVAAHDPRMRAVVLEGGFTSLEGMIEHDERRFGWWSERAAVASLRRAGIAIDRVRPIDVICDISPRPVLIIDGAEDDDSPVADERRLFAAACEPRTLIVIPHAGHASYASGGVALATSLTGFFDRGLLPPPDQAGVLRLTARAPLGSRRGASRH